MDFYSLANGLSPSCGCVSAERIGRQARARAIPIKNGTRFGRLTIIDAQRPNSMCRCDCGAEKAVATNNLIQGFTKSCGCLKRDLTRELGKRQVKHGRSFEIVYQTWSSMIRRVDALPPKSDWKYYGSRGITVDPAWRDLDVFTAYVNQHLGPRPAGHSLDRIHNGGNYEPGNIRWASFSQQMRNRGH